MKPRWKLSKKIRVWLAIFIPAVAAVIAAIISAANDVNLFVVFSSTFSGSAMTDAPNDNIPVPPTVEPATPTPEPSPTPEPMRWAVRPYEEPDGSGLYCIWYFEYDNLGKETGNVVINGYTNTDFSGDLVWIYEGGFIRDPDLNVKPHGDKTRTFYWNEDNGGHFDYAVGQYADGERVGTRTYWVLSGVVQPSGHDKEREPIVIDDILTGTLREGEYTKTDD
ncbi:hypothetical protein FACS189490_12640 [Clostridia bacterium]|nr:hypothetical protein FACS189490_12640 [Clostridia bacterium]